MEIVACSSRTPRNPLTRRVSGKPLSTNNLENTKIYY
jgi:hypothetical protein